MKRIGSGVVAGLVAAAVLAAPAAAGPKVTVRVEGESATLLERTQLTLPDTGSGVCPGKRWTVADALDAATAGNWNRGEFVTTILGESHIFADSDYWALWNGDGGGYRFATVGICEQVMAEGEEALLLVDRSPPPTFAPSRFPLALRGLPAAVQAGTPVTVSVVGFGLDGAAGPAPGATVSGGGAEVVTGPDGAATIVFTQPGTFAVKARRAGGVSSAGELVTVSAAAPGTAPSGSGGAGPGASRPSRAADRTAPRASFIGLRSGRAFSRRKAPRELKGRVTADPSGLRSVRLAVTRRVGKRCWAFDGTTERFERHRCGGWRSWRIGDRPEWSYLLPRKLPKGRYTIRVAAIDKAGNDSVTRTRIRVR